MKRSSLLACLFILFLFSCKEHPMEKKPAAPVYTPDSKELYDTIVQMDSIFFEAYNTCKMTVMDSMLSQKIEFYHDKGGLETSHQAIVDALKKNICGKVTRELLPGSIEVYPINNYGAVEMGMHGFHNNQEKQTGPTKFSRFVTIWHKENDKWKMSRVISLH